MYFSTVSVHVDDDAELRNNRGQDGWGMEKSISHDGHFYSASWLSISPAARSVLLPTRHLQEIWSGSHRCLWCKVGLCEKCSKRDGGCCVGELWRSQSDLEGGLHRGEQALYEYVFVNIAISFLFGETKEKGLQSARSFSVQSFYECPITESSDPAKTISSFLMSCLFQNEFLLKVFRLY